MIERIKRIKRIFGNDNSAHDSILDGQLIDALENSWSYEKLEAAMYKKDFKDVKCLRSSLKRDLDNVKFLVEKKANVNILDREGNTALMQAALSGSLEMVKFLIEKKAEVNHVNLNGVSALMQAALNGSLEIVKFLLEEKANLNQVNRNGATALMRAAYIGSLDIVQCLVAKKAKVNSANQYNRTALMEGSGSVDVVRFLLEKKARVNDADQYGATALMKAVSYSSFDSVKLLIEKKADVNFFKRDEDTALMYSAWQGTLGIVKFLIEKKANVNQVNRDGATALTYAASHGCFDVVKFLIEIKANVNSINSKDGYSILMTAIKSQKPNRAIVDLLLEEKATINFNNSSACRNVLSEAAEHGYSDIVEALLNNGASVYAKDQVLALAAYNGHCDLVKLLLNRGAQFHDADSILVAVAAHGFDDIVAVLIANKANVNAHNRYGETPLVNAVTHDHLKVIKRLLANRAMTDFEIGSREKTALMIAAEHGKLEIVRLLLENRAEVYKRDMHGETALKYAIAGGHADVVQILLSEKIIDRDRVEALNEAIIYHRELAVVSVLLQQKVKISDFMRLFNFIKNHGSALSKNIDKLPDLLYALTELCEQFDHSIQLNGAAELLTLAPEELSALREKMYAYLYDLNSFAALYREKIIEELKEESDHPYRELTGIIADYLGVSQSPGPLYTQACSAFFKREATVACLLQHVVKGELKQAEVLLKKNSELLLLKGKVTDPVGRTFKNITAFQYALWVLNSDMWTELLRYLPREQAALQLKELELKGTEHGNHFDPSPLVATFQTYVDHFDLWDIKQRTQYWYNKVIPTWRRIQSNADILNEFYPETPPLPIIKSVLKTLIFDHAKGHDAFKLFQKDLEEGLSIVDYRFWHG